MGVNGIIGTWAGPDAPGTAYVLLHHSIGDVGDGEVGSWGFPRGGMGGVSDAIRRAAESFGARVCTDAPVERVLVRDGKVVGVALVDGRGDRDRRWWSPPCTRRSASSATSSPACCPTTSSTDIRRWRSRSGTVKVNVALSELPSFVADPGHDLRPHHTGAIELAFSLDHLETAFQDARAGSASTMPFADCVHPVGVGPHPVPRRHPRDVDVHPVGARVVGRRARRRRAPGLRRPRGRPLRPGRTRVREVDPAPAGDRPLRDGAHLRADRRQHLPR